MTTPQAKKLVKALLDEKGIPYDKLQARTVGFADLARDEKLFVTIKGWDVAFAQHVDSLKQIGRDNGFVVSFSGPGIIG